MNKIKREEKENLHTFSDTTSFFRSSCITMDLPIPAFPYNKPNLTGLLVDASFSIHSKI
ncbi:Uncharacterised protein [uncultured Prevotella sp.]|nr:Uncharacterised protein [uncultured Prevotella sp.]